MKLLSKKLTGQKIRDEMKKRNMTVRELQEVLELDSPQSIYKWLRGESLPSLQNMVVLGELFQVPIEKLLVNTDGSLAFHRIFDDSFPYHIGFLFQENNIHSSKRRSAARSGFAAKNLYTGLVTEQENCHQEAPHS